MVHARLASSLAKPSSNITGVSILATNLDGKRQELLTEAVPRSSPNGSAHRSELIHLAAAAGAARRRTGAGRSTFDPPSYPARGDRPCNRRGEGQRCRSAQRSGVSTSLQQPRDCSAACGGAPPACNLPMDHPARCACGIDKASLSVDGIFYILTTGCHWRRARLTSTSPAFSRSVMQQL